MNKAELIEHISKVTKLPKASIKQTLEVFVETVGNILKKNDQVTLTGFGTFTVTKRKARSGINPVTKAKMTIPAKKVPKFKPGKALRDKVS